ncbi:DUF6250 domain-containing protein [Rubrivivax rivuli]|uniref:DUF6250 domain-containing protein n=1 Tax=Rubrivivax rivuli TaxID=1862385 RepID=A0A437RB23_9BURK|nr:DUF6250 domain-containing protein [Rubrivivax rivuli]RVU43935.1 hypothetical protein EOE66_19995 [Rubrivivax rivuli]
MVGLALLRRSAAAATLAGVAACAGAAPSLLACAPGQAAQRVDGDTFTQGLVRWRLEAQDPRAVVQAEGGVLDVQTPAGLSLWWRSELQGDFELRFTATALPAPATAGALAGRISDLNLFWHATEPDGREPAPRNGAFASYDSLRLYYAGIGANGNATTRLRHYSGTGARTLLDGWADGAEATPQDRRGAMTPATRLVAGQPVLLQLLSRAPTPADPVHARLVKDGQPLFTLQAGADTPAPLQRGWFALRTTASRLQLRGFELWQCRAT